MGRGTGLPFGQRYNAIGMLKFGMTLQWVARHFGVCTSTIGRLTTRFRQTGTVKDRPSWEDRVKRRNVRIVTSSRRQDGIDS